MSVPNSTKQEKIEKHINRGILMCKKMYAYIFIPTEVSLKYSTNASAYYLRPISYPEIKPVYAVIYVLYNTCMCFTVIVHAILLTMSVRQIITPYPGPKSFK